ncbi:hypothetical protein QX776_06695 [Alteromonadaceae bacterium BrNp21-10]|nr:hypothetical protein [Alteromonadaceae bacterium BrNp21-10]
MSYLWKQVPTVLIGCANRHPDFFRLPSMAAKPIFHGRKIGEKVLRDGNFLIPN